MNRTASDSPSRAAARRPPGALASLGPIAALGTLAALLAAAPAAGVNPKTHAVSDPALATGDVQTSPAPRFSPDGEWIVFVQPTTPGGGAELWSARRGAGKAPARLSPPLTAPRAVTAFAITADSARVVFLADFDATGQFELLSAPIDGGAGAVVLHPQPVAGGDVLEFALSPNGERAVFRGDLTTKDQVRLWSTPVAGPAAAADLISVAPESAGGDVLAFAPTAGATPRVVFAGTLRANGAVELYSTPLAGPASQSVRISPNPTAGAPGVALGPGLGFAPTPNGARVVFAAAFLSLDDVGLWSNGVLGPASQADELSPLPVAGGDVVEFRIAPNGARAAFRGDLEVDERFELWSVPVDDSSPADKLSLAAPHALGDVTHFALGFGTPGQALFRADSQVDEQFDVWRRAIDGAGTAPTRLNPAAVAGADGEPDLAVAPDGSDLVFRGDFATAGEIELWRSAANGGTGSAIRLNPNPPAGGDVTSFVVDPSSSRVVFRGDVTTNDREELRSAPSNGPAGQSVRLHPAPGANESVDAYAVAPDGARVALLADLATPGVDALWTAPIGGPDTAAVQAHPDSPVGGAALPPLVWSADGLGVLFRGALAADDRVELWDADEWVLAADFEEGDTSEWSATFDGS
jgi:hypothetical protein